MTRVLLAPENPAGVATALRDALRERGHTADVVSFRAHPFGYAHDRLADTPAARIREGLRALHRYDVLHWQFGTTLLEFLEAAAARARPRRPLQLMHYWGDDARTVRRARQLGSPRAEVLERQAGRRDDGTVVRRLRLAGRLCDAAVTADLELAAYLEGFFARVLVVPTPLVPLPAALDPSPPTRTVPRVLHAPSDRRTKGTAAIEPVLRELAAAGVIEPRAVAGVPHTEVLAAIADADVVADQLDAQTTGVLALEAMALGRPVLAQYRPELLAPFARRSPAVATTAATLRDDLAALAADPARRAALGESGRAFVAKTHEAGRVAAALEHVYAAARTIPPGRHQVTADGLTRV
jgi:glycosyltransferase involved in cell wall biosynthesis